MRTTVSETMEKMNEQGVVHYAIDWLRDNGFIPQEDLDIKSISEQEYDDALNKLKGNYMSISKEDEQTIINIAKRF
jgi:hypothetical protein